jgi:hypothetical protein
MAAPASAIPICPSGTMADYLGFGAGAMTVEIRPAGRISA